VPPAAKSYAGAWHPAGQGFPAAVFDGEIYLQIQENVRGTDVFVVQPTCPPVDRHVMQLLLMIDALKRPRHSASRQCYPIMGMPVRIGKTNRAFDFGQADRQLD